MAEPEMKRMRWTFDEPCTKMERNSGHPVKVVAITADEDGDGLTMDHMPAYNGTRITILLVTPDSTGTLETSHFRFIPQTVHEEMGVMISECQTSLQNGSVVGVKTPVFRSSGHRYALVGLGNLEALTNERVGLKVGVTIANICMEEKGCNTCILIPPDHIALSPNFIEDMTCSLRTQLYSDNRYRTGDNKKFPAENLRFVLIHMEDAEEDWVQDSINRGNQLSRGQTLAKDIVNAPHNVLNSESLADLAKALVNESISGKLTCSILGKKECESLGMGAYLAVARGSETEPQFIHMTYKSDGAIK
jgi:leucyl aminopeptidase